MKAIAGIVRFDSQPVEKHTLATMMARMAHAAPHAANIWQEEVWQEGPVALGSIHWHDHANGAPPVFPANNGNTQSAQWPWLQIVLDGRLDNRKELQQQTGFAAHSRMADDELILACYAKWGEETPAHLVGDYAFAIWDRRRHRLFCARDHFGLRPFYLYLGPQFFMFASDLRAILANPEVPQQINELRVALHLSVQPPDNHLTFYQGIERLLPAHSLLVSESGNTVQKQYWSIGNVRELQLKGDTDYADAFREIFTEAVACRIPEVRPVGALLSGGLDSTSVTSMLHRLIYAESDRNQGGFLHTFSAIFEKTPACDERNYIDATLQLGGITPHFVDVESSSPLGQLDKMLAVIGEPFPSPTLYIPWQVYQAASKHGIQVVFDGMDGDTAVHHGDAYLAELARSGRWSDFFSLAKAIAERKKLPLLNSLMYRYGNPYLKSLASQWRWHRLHQELRRLSPYTVLPARRLFFRYVRDHSLRPLISKAGAKAAPLMGIRRQEQHVNTGVMSQTLVRQSDLLDYIQAHAQAKEPPASSRQEHYQQLTTPLLPQIFEISMRVAQAFGIEVRQPFTDRRLIEFCYALPPQQKVADGWTRNIVRRGLAGILPEAIRQRGDKALNSQAVTKAFLSDDACFLENLVSDRTAALGRFVDMAKLQESYHRYRANPNSQDEMYLWQSATLAVWLRQKDVANNNCSYVESWK